MANKQYYIVSGVLFLIISVAHLLRLLFGLPIHVDEFVVPMLVSWIGFAVTGGLALWAFRLSRAKP